MYRGFIVACLLLTIAFPLAGWATDPAIEAAETSVRLGVAAGYGSFANGGSGWSALNEPMLGVTAGVSDLTPADGLGLWFPDLYAGAAYDFSYGLSGSRRERQYSTSTPFSLHDEAYGNTAIVRLGAGMPLGDVAEAIPYVAAGYENWSRRLAGPGAYGGFYQSELLGGGLRFDIAASPAFIVSASAEGLAMLGGSGSAPSRDFNGDFGADAQERVSLDADYRLSRTWHAYAGLGLGHFEYSRSKIDVFDAGAALQIDSMFGIGYGF